MPFRDAAADRRGPAAPLEVELGADSTSQLYADLGGAVVGVFASTFLVLARDVRVDLVMSFPDGRGIRTSGLVKFVRTADVDQLPGLGVAFIELAPADRELVRQFVEHVRPPMLYEE